MEDKEKHELQIDDALTSSEADETDINVLEYSENPFVIITESNQKIVIDKYCDAVFVNDLTDNEEELLEMIHETKSDADNKEVDHDKIVLGKKFLKKFLWNLPKPITIIQEMYHIDRSYRDTYYMYFSNQHFTVKRYSRRLSFFLGEYDVLSYFAEDIKIEKELRENFIGSCVINPLIVGSIGRTLINPKFLLGAHVRPVYVRLSEFKLNVYGRVLFVKAFPYRMQDEETMCCAEVTLLNLLEYYSNSYDDYRTVVPSEIIENEQKHSYERVLPARGITYPVLTKVLSEFGFSPRLYNISAIDSYQYSYVSQKDELRRWLHYYIESGIPVAVNLTPISTAGTAHSIVCIGHGKVKPELKKRAYKKRWIAWGNRECSHPLINSADFYDDYVVVDDNEPVYQVRNFDSLSLFSDMKVENLAVPLYKRMFLDAPNAYTIIRSLLHSEMFGIEGWSGDFLAKGENVVIRLFMASSRSYKDYRMHTMQDTYVKQLYTLIPMPRFVWVCELYRLNDYDNLLAFGEVVIDATSAPNRGHRSLILMHYPCVIAYRHPDQTEVGFEYMAELEEDALFSGYQKNLVPIK